MLTFSVLKIEVLFFCLDKVKLNVLYKAGINLGFPILIFISVSYFP